MPYALQTLDIARSVGVLGDTHGVVEPLLAALDQFDRLGVKTIVQLGDFGWPWPGKDWEAELRQISARLDNNQQVLYAIDGNHDWRTRLEQFEPNLDGTRSLASNIRYAPRGLRIRSGYRPIFGFLGGAASVDTDRRVVGESWWPEEQITEADIDALGTEPLTVLFSHEVPIGSHRVDKIVMRGTKPGGTRGAWWPTDDLNYAQEGRARLTRAFQNVGPVISFAGHWHRHVDISSGFTTSRGSLFTSRIIALDECGSTESPSMAILDPSRLRVEIVPLPEPDSW
jgi:hypothetical protein